MFVNYVREINAFNRYANEQMMGSGERLLWFGLMDCINTYYASGADWPTDYVSIPNKRLLSHVPFSEDAMIEARNRLKQRGLIDYMPGKKNRTAPAYRVRYFSAGDAAEGCAACYPGSYPEKTGGYLGNHPGNHPDINLNVNYTQNVNVYDEDDEEEEETRARTREAGETAQKAHEGTNAPQSARRMGFGRGHEEEDEALRALAQETRRAQQAASTAYRAAFGRAPTPMETERIAQAAANVGLIGMLPFIIGRAAMAAPRNPVRYILTILDDYQAQGIASEAEASRYEYLRDCMSGRRQDMDIASAQQAMEAERRARRERRCSARREGG